MNKTLELREKRAKAWEAAKAFLDTKRGENGLISAEDNTVYEKMEADEEIAFQNNKIILNETPYPIPLLNVYAEDHYIDSKSYDGEAYANFNATKNAVSAYETVFKNAGHLNFTDLPLFSPALAKMLGVGTIDELYCIEKMNEVVLEFFNCFLKDTAVLKIAKEY